MSQPAPEEAQPQIVKKKDPQAHYQMDNFNRIREIVKRAIAAHHTFMIHGRSRIIRDCLLERGWCEKFHKKNHPSPNVLSSNSDQHSNLGVDSSPTTLMAGIGDLSDRTNERLLISRMLGTHTVDFLWNGGSEWTGWPSQENKTTIFNRFTRASFTSKVGLCSNVRQMHWFYEAGIANTLFPRCYNISQPDQMHSFIEDYRMTACLSLLKWLVDKNDDESVRSPSGQVPLRALDFAIGRCSDFIGSSCHEDLDQEFDKVWSHQWEQFIGWYCRLVHGQGQLVSNNVPLSKYLQAARHLLKKVEKHWPQLEMDGIMNIWILKPGNKSRGRGIVLMNKLDDILAKVNPNYVKNGMGSCDSRFVVQKYIERPLLIYDTKFDIRQWFIITSAQPLTIWVYRESYLRFCSQKFSLTDFHESIHLSNNAVQCKYKNSPDRHECLPSDNMWDVAAFKEYLRVVRGDPEAWDKLIYPGMKQGLVGSLLASQEAMDRRKNSFELYGADFMVMEDYSVWLIEINSHPDMSNSTSVTTKLCRKAMEDTIKVVVDYRENNGSDTGDFELVYRQKVVSNASSSSGYLGSGLFLHGTRIPMNPVIDLTKKPSIFTPQVSSQQLTKKLDLKPVGAVNRVGPVLIDLIESLELQLDHEFYEYLKLRSTSGLTRSAFFLPKLSPAPKTSPMSQSLKCDTETNTNLLFMSSPAGMAGNYNGTAPNANLPPNTTTTNNGNNVTTNKVSTGKSSKLNRKNIHHKKILKRENQIKNPTEVIGAIPFKSTNKAFIPKIIDLHQRDVKNKLSNYAASHSAANKFYHVVKAPGFNGSDNIISSQVSENFAISKNKKSDVKKLAKTASTKDIPSSISSRLKGPIDAQKPDMKASQSTFSYGFKLHHRPIKNKRNRAKSKPKIFDVDTNNIYAVGLAVNK